MNKKSDNNISTQRILKSKYLDRDKQKTIPLLKTQKSKNRIKLVDLCPEEKLKIGELIKTLETRRLENEELKREIEQLRSHLEASKQQAERMAEERLKEQRIVGELRAEIERMKDEIERSWLRNEELERAVKEYAKAINRKSKTKSKNIQTQAATTAEQCVGMQTEVMSADTQTQQQQQRTRDLFYRPHSKSFEKIMKGTFLNLQTAQTHPHERSQLRPHANSNRTDKVMQSGSNSLQNEDEFIEELHLKWDQLKAKNRQLPSNSPHSFNASSEKQSSRKQSKLDEIDEASLNRMLRLKGFSASKLMRMGKEANSQSRKEESPEVNYLKSPYFNRPEPAELSQPKKPHNLKKSPPASEEPINFYESDLFE